jgi:hypothetical protein
MDIVCRQVAIHFTGILREIDDILIQFSGVFRTIKLKIKCIGSMLQYVMPKELLLKAMFSVIGQL